MGHQSSAVGTTAGFDPAAEVFVAQFARPETLQPVNFRALSPFYRSLLVIDGTVTKFIEAFTMEPVVVERLSQEELVLPADHEWLEAPAGTRVIAREVLLTRHIAWCRVRPRRLAPGRRAASEQRPG